MRTNIYKTNYYLLCSHSLALARFATARVFVEIGDVKRFETFITNSFR